MADRTNNDDLKKVVSEDVMSAIESASGNLKGTAYTEINKAIEAAKNEENNTFFNPTLSQYREGMIINTSREFAKVRKVPVGTGGNEAWVITGAVGRRNGDKIEYTGAFNMYPSTLRKQIQVTDEMGDQVLNEQKQPVMVNGAGNEVWEAARACQTTDQLLSYALDKVFEVASIKRDFGPSVFVKQADGSRKATSHKLTSLPLFNIIG